MTTQLPRDLGGGVRPRSLRAWLVGIGCGSIFATLLVAALGGWLSWHEQEARLEAMLVATSRAIIQSGDSEFDQAVALGRALSASELLNTGDFAGFDQQARLVLRHYGYTLVLSEPQRDLPLVDTRRPLGSPMAPLPADWNTRLLAAPNKPAI